MAIRLAVKFLVALGLLMALASDRVFAQSNVDPVNRYSWGANIGWIDWRSNGVNGAVFTTQTAAGFIYSATIGWINLGDGTPVSGGHYSNTVAGDCGVNIDSASDPDYFILSGYAYSANVGWINFNVGGAHQPRIHKKTGVLAGSAWGANIGWLPLTSLPAAQVGTSLIYSGVWGWGRYK